jgi:hypothetical protein
MIERRAVALIEEAGLGAAESRLTLQAGGLRRRGRNGRALLGRSRAAQEEQGTEGERPDEVSEAVLFPAHAAGPVPIAREGCAQVSDSKMGA